MKVLNLTKALADATRLRLLILLSQAHLTLAQTETLLDQSGPRLSRHLKILVKAGLVARSKEGKEAFFRLSHETEVRSLVNPLIEALLKEDTYGDLPRLQRFVDKAQQTAQDLEAKFYTKWNQARDFFVDEQQAEDRLVAIAQRLNHVPDESLSRDQIFHRPTFLDIGTGTGRLLSTLGPYVSAGLGIDTDRDMLSIARHRLTLEDLSHMSVRQGDMYDLDLEGQHFDLVCLYGVLRYAALPSPVLTQAAGVLALKGTLVVVDFLEHEHAELSSFYGHKWLGFDSRDLSNWTSSAGLVLQNQEEFVGAKLTLGLWSYAKRPVL